jgi:MerR family mercuric resistance operon transcriptional regulator
MTRLKLSDITDGKPVKLADVSARCEGGDVPECPIIDTLFGRGPGAR